MLVQITTELNSNPVICGKCRGKCCNQQPGITHPTQWGKTRAQILKNLKAAFSEKPYSKWAVDWWQGDTDPSYELYDVYFVRPSAIGNLPLFHGAGRDRVCIFLGDEGCSLKPYARPVQCLGLVPDKKYECEWTEGNSKKELAHAWRPYQKEILEAAKFAGSNPGDRREDYVPMFGF